MSLDLRARVALALDEDLGAVGDLTTDATIPASLVGSGVLLAKQDLVVSGLEAARLVFEVAAQRLGGFVTLRPAVTDGQGVAAGTVVAKVHGNVRAILIGERPALNLMMRMSGIATHTRAVVAAAGPTTFRIVDTRKTTPLWRDLEKAAVRHGGGASHRFGLFDGVLIKDNHVAAVGSVGEAVRRAREAVHHLVRVQVEVTDLAELAEALDAEADAVLLDNMDDDALQAAVDVVRARRPQTVIEASGGMTAERLRRIAAFGLDIVSMGGLIHQARWADLSLDLDTSGPPSALV